MIFAASGSSTDAVYPLADDRRFWLESLDGSHQVQLGVLPFVFRPGAVGLEGPPVDAITVASPGVDGSTVADVVVRERPVALPLSIRAQAFAPASRAQVRMAKALLRSIVGHRTAQSSTGSCRLVCASDSGVRELLLQYRGGLEGDEQGVPHYDRVGLDTVAVDPWARDRADRALPFGVAGAQVGMVATDPVAAAAAGWVRGLASSVVLGADMPVDIVSEVSVWATLDLTGPFTGSLHVSTDSGLDVTVPGGLAAGEVLHLASDPRARSIRVNGVQAAGRVALGSTMAPLRPGRNLLSVVGSGATSASQVVVSWRPGWWSLW